MAEPMAEDMIVVGRALPRLLSAAPLTGRNVRLRFDDGSERIIDLSPALASKRIFLPLRTDDALFRTLRVSEYGDSIEWDGGLDFSAIWLDRLPNAAMSNDEFRDIMSDLGMTLDGMALALEISRRQVAHYRDNASIPKHIALATRYLAEHSTVS
jgi:hypothetical protein